MIDMTIVQGLDWAVGLVGKYFAYLDTCMIVPGVSVISFSVAVILLVVIIGAIVMRV